ncbi:MAG: hypothetical protein KAX49_16480 [Halanaerobiales bacterium]|nr:hypothetical protein [Halanaerobiales bacterium]
MDRKHEIHQYLTTLQIFSPKENLDDILLHAEKEQKSYQALVYDLLKAEID